MPPSVVIQPPDPWPRGTPGMVTQSPDRPTRGRGERGAIRRAPLQRRRAAGWWGWQAVLLAVFLWALCQEEAPPLPSLYLGQVWRHALLAGGLGAGLALGTLVLRALCPQRPRQGAPCLRAAEVGRERAAALQAECVPPFAEASAPLSLSLPGGRSANGPVPLANALMDSLLLCLLSESLEDPCPAHIQALAHRLEMVNQTLGRADVLEESPKQAAVPGGRGTEEPLLLTDSLQDIRTFLRERAQCLRALAQAQGDYGSSIQAVKELLQQCWIRLVKLHIQAILRRKRRAAQRRVHATARKEGEGNEGAGKDGEGEEREGVEDIEKALRDVERFSLELTQRKARLQKSQTLLTDLTHLLQDLGGGLRALGERGGEGAEPLWTERLLQADTQQFDEAVQDFLSLEKLTSCFLTHLEGLRDQAGGRKPHPPPDQSSSSRPPALPIYPPHPGPRPPGPPSDPPGPPPAAAKASSLCERSAQRLSSTFTRLRCTLRSSELSPVQPHTCTSQPKTAPVPPTPKPHLHLPPKTTPVPPSPKPHLYLPHQNHTCTSQPKTAPVPPTPKPHLHLPPKTTPAPPT